MEGTGCLTDALKCSPTTWASAGIASPITSPVAPMAQPFENARLDTFIHHLLVYKLVLVDPTLTSRRGPIACRQPVIPRHLLRPRSSVNACLLACRAPRAFSRAHV